MENISNHGEEKSHVSNQTLNGSESLNSNMLLFSGKEHSGAKSHACDQCPQSFTRAGHLKTHMLIHSGVKPHECKQCHQSFTRSGTLKRHMLIHSGEKPHGCKQCHQSFTTSGDLKRHMLIHSGAKPHGCKQCPNPLLNLEN